MQQTSSTEIHSGLEKAVQAFKEMKYPVTRNQLLEKAKSMNARTEGIQAIENIPDKEYTSSNYIIKALGGN